MELPIYVYGTDILREPTKEVTPDLPGLQKLIAYKLSITNEPDMIKSKSLGRYITSGITAFLKTCFFHTTRLGNPFTMANLT